MATALVFVNLDGRVEIGRVDTPIRFPAVDEVVILDDALRGRTRYVVRQVESYYGDTESHKSAAAKAMGGPFDVWEADVHVIVEPLPEGATRG